jgi:uncharacterized protein YkwD
MADRGGWAAIGAACVLAAATLVVPATASPAPAGRQMPSRSLAALESGVLQQLNRIRVEHRLAPLRLNADLTDSSLQHTREMAADGYFAHDSHDGTAFWRRIQHWYGSAGYHSWSVGENLLWSSPSVDPAGAMRLWMHSPEHRANILDPRWREIGVAAVHVAGAPGTYHRLPVTIVTTDFGVRR